VAKDIVVAWIVTMPAAGLIAAVFTLLATALHIA
jgi:phosphate/sulfate permease